MKLFFKKLGQFLYDHFTDKSGFWDEKRTTAFVLILLALGYGLFKWFGEPNVQIFLALLGAGVSNYFISALNDGRGPWLRSGENALGNYVANQAQTPTMGVSPQNGGTNVNDRP